MARRIAIPDERRVRFDGSTSHWVGVDPTVTWMGVNSRLMPREVRAQAEVVQEDWTGSECPPISFIGFATTLRPSRAKKFHHAPLSRGADWLLS